MENDPMPAIDSTVAQPELTPAETVGPDHDRVLPSGRSVLIKVKDGREELEVRSPQGEVEVRITLSDSGPVVNLRAARLELESADTLSLTCRRLEVNTIEATKLQSSGTVQITGQEMQVQTQDDIHLNGKIIRLNC
jgi:hypothetical protein